MSNRANNPNSMFAILFAIVVFLTQSAHGTPCTASGLDSYAELGGTCATYNNQLVDGSMGICAGLVDYPYFLPNGKTQEDLEGEALQALVAGDPSGGSLFALLPPRCANVVKETLCTAAFQRCELVDDFFIDTCTVACNPSVTCTRNGKLHATCGNAATTSCALSPGLPGLLQAANTPLTWQQIYDATAISVPNLTFESFCQSQGMTYVMEEASCMRAIPRTPCKATCDSIHSMDDSIVSQEIAAECPLVSGLFFTLLRGALASSDPFLVSEATRLLSDVSGNDCSGTLTPPQEQLCAVSTFNINLFSLVLPSLPSCSNKVSPTLNYYQFGSTYTLEAFVQPRDPNVSLGALILAKRQALSMANVECGESPGFSCANYLVKATCFPRSELPKVTVQPTIATGVPKGLKDTCGSLTSDVPDESVESLTKLLPGVPFELLRSMRYVTPAVGMPPIPSHPQGGFLAQPNVEDKTPLCSFLVRSTTTGVLENQVGTTAHECAHLRLQNLIGQLPSWVDFGCQSALQELACRVSELKPEPKTMCLLPTLEGKECVASPVQGATEKKLGFSYLLPRFPAREMCEKVRVKCLSLSSFLLGSNKDKFDELIKLTDCSQKIRFDCVKENQTWQSKIWPCTTPFDGLDAFPEERQTFLTIAQLPVEVAANIRSYALQVLQKGDEYLADQFSSSVIEPSTRNFVQEAADAKASGNSSFFLQGTCQCPYPLQAPDNPLDGGLDSFICCNQPCATTMFTNDEVSELYILQISVAAASFTGASFVALTWACFKEKRKQYLTLYFTVTSCTISALMIISSSLNLTFTENDTPVDEMNPYTCRTNTEGARALEGGFCLVQSVILIYFGLSASCWWFCQSFDLYIKLVRGKNNIDNEKKYHIYSWGLPFLSTTILLANDKLGYAPPVPYCLFASDTEAQWDFTLWYVPVLIMLVLGTFFVIQSIRVMYRHRSAKLGLTLGSKHRRRINHVYYTSALFVVVFMLVWGFIFFYRLDLELKRSSIEEGVTRWATCLLTNFANGTVDPATNPVADNSILPEREPGTGCGVKLPVFLDVSGFWLFLMMAIGQGFLVFTIFGFRMSNIRLWRKGVKGVFSSVEQMSGYNERTGTRQKGSYTGGTSNSHQGASSNSVARKFSNMSSNNIRFSAASSPSNGANRWVAPPSWGSPSAYSSPVQSPHGSFVSSPGSRLRKENSYSQSDDAGSYSYYKSDVSTSPPQSPKKKKKRRARKKRHSASYDDIDSIV